MSIEDAAFVIALKQQRRGPGGADPGVKTATSEVVAPRLPRTSICCATFTAIVHVARACRCLGLRRRRRPGRRIGLQTRCNDFGPEPASTSAWFVDRGGDRELGIIALEGSKPASLILLQKSEDATRLKEVFDNIIKAKELSIKVHAPPPDGKGRGPLTRRSVSPGDPLYRHAVREALESVLTLREVPALRDPMPPATFKRLPNADRGDRRALRLRAFPAELGPALCVGPGCASVRVARRGRLSARRRGNREPRDPDALHQLRGRGGSHGRHPRRHVHHERPPALRRGSDVLRRRGLRAAPE